MGELPELENIAACIVVLRGRRVMLDADLARLYGVSTSRLNEQVRRNEARFPSDFMFRLSPQEWGRCRKLRQRCSAAEGGIIPLLPSLSTAA